MTLSKRFFPVMLLLAVLFLGSCEPTVEEEKEGKLRIELTDAPIDDASVSAVFVTVADVKVGGKSLEGFNKTTIDVLAYQNGETVLLANSDMKAESYNDITLVLDYETDAAGNSPGCYVEEEGNGAKHALITSETEINLSHDVEVKEESETNVVIDFDLRKCIKRSSSSQSQYEFVTESEMEAGIRVVNKTEVGVVNGNCSDLFSNSDKVVVYAYKKGEYNRDMEVQGQGQSNVEFAKAETSASVNANGNYELHFLEEGEYELHYCSYEESSNGEMELKGTLLVDVVGSVDLGSISVGANASVSVNVLVTGVLPI